MAKVIGTVEQCYHCPNCAYNSGGRYVCTKSHQKTIHDTKAIPIWCPLPDAVGIVPSGVRASAPTPDWQQFVCYLIDHCEGETVTEEGLQRWAAEFLKEPRYTSTAGVMVSDDWQQYAKEGETAQAVIERERRESAALLKLLAHARGEPLTDPEIIAMLPAGWTGMLAQVMQFARRIEAARGLPASGDSRAAMQKALEALTEVRDLIGESQGVYGLHLNGDPSPWDELEAGGRFERLTSLDEATETLRAALGVAIPEGGQK